MLWVVEPQKVCGSEPLVIEPGCHKRVAADRNIASFTHYGRNREPGRLRADKIYFLQKWMPKQEGKWSIAGGFEVAKSAGAIFRLAS